MLKKSIILLSALSSFFYLPLDARFPEQEASSYKWKVKISNFVNDLPKPILLQGIEIKPYGFLAINEIASNGTSVTFSYEDSEGKNTAKTFAIDSKSFPDIKTGEQVDLILRTPEELDMWSYQRHGGIGYEATE